MIGRWLRAERQTILELVREIAAILRSEGGLEVHITIRTGKNDG